MIPVALLAIEPSHTVLDLCASPGSKTTQVLRCKSANQRSATQSNATLLRSSRLAGLDTTAGRVLIAQERHSRRDGILRV